jgi:hypothetical protein
MIQKHLRLRGFGTRRTKAVILHEILSDRSWHSTKELSHRVGHTFAVATYLLRKSGHIIKTERHPGRRHQYRYCLLDQRESS